MPTTTHTFAGQLRHFARSVDIVDDEIFDRVRHLIYKYVKNELGAAYFEVMREQLGTPPGLKMFWSSDEHDHYWPIDEYGTATNVVTMAFSRDRPIWLVATDRVPLSEDIETEDEWSQMTGLPGYRPAIDRDVRTVVVLPLRRKQRRLGVCYFECGAHIPITEVAKEELQLLADAISILLDLYEVNRSQSVMTSSAIEELQDRLESAKFPRLTRPHFFLAFSNRADRQVVDVMNEVLRVRADQLEYTDWSSIDESGNISTQIVKEVIRSRFGICYFSEPSADSGFVDNPNVVFEAGMLHARTAIDGPSDGGDPAGWIPVREKASPPAPFDFATERILEVPRFDDETLQTEELRRMLDRRIGKLLGVVEP